MTSSSEQASAGGRKAGGEAQTKAAILPPAKPKIEKATGATRLAVFGDSMAIDLAKALERFYAEDPNISIMTQGVGSSGFVRPDFFDWPKTIGEQITANSFDIAVFIIGINDRQKMKLNAETYGSLTPEWTAEYSARVVERGERAARRQQADDLDRPAADGGAEVRQDDDPGQRNPAARGLRRRRGVPRYLRALRRPKRASYTSHGPDLNGNQVRMRKDDGIHFSAAGADKLAFYLSQTLKLYYRGGGAVGIEVADPLLGTDAQLMMRPPYQGLGQMKLLEVAGAVISLTHAPRRATDLVTADMADVERRSAST